MNAAQIHLALNHFPLILVIVGTLVLAYSLWKRQTQFRTLALMLFVAAAVTALPTYITGEGTEEVVERMPGVTESVIDAHEDAASLTIAFVEALGAASIVGFVVMRKRDALVKPVAATLLIVGIAAISSIAWTAHLGGQIRHTELRGSTATVAPAVNAETD